MKISKLFHWLYAFLMVLPFIALIFNLVRVGLSGSLDLTSFDDTIGLIRFATFGGNTLASTVYSVYNYLLATVFGYANNDIIKITIVQSLTYWTNVSLIYLIFDVFMYVPLLVHRWIDKAVID